MMPKDLGKKLEHRVNKANYKYRKNGTAMIKKEEVPILLTKKGLVVTQSTVDYIGVIPIITGLLPRNTVGIYIAFDAKETKSKTSFPLANIHQHQLEFLKFIHSVGGLTFFMIQFTSLHEDQVFLVPITFVYKIWEDAINGKRKSIRYKDFKPEWLINIDDYLKPFINKLCTNSWVGMYKL